MIEILRISLGEARSHNLIPTNNRRNQDEPPKTYNNQETLKQGQADGPETTAKTQGNLGHPHPPADGEALQGPCALQPDNRQQAAKL